MVQARGDLEFGQGPLGAGCGWQVRGRELWGARAPGATGPGAKRGRPRAGMMPAGPHVGPTVGHALPLSPRPRRPDTMGMPDTARPYTVEEVLAFPDDGNRYELVGGELLVTRAPNQRHQIILVRLALPLS